MHATVDRKYLGELFWNQLWQSAGFLSKAVFLALLTPLMLAHWGAEHYGLFALASSLLVSMGLLDGGVRALTRVRLADALGKEDPQTFGRALGSGVLTFSAVVISATAAGAALAATGKLAEWLDLPAGGSLVLAVTMAMTGFFMITNLALEPLAAEGRLSAVKAANTWGAILAIPICGIAVLLDGTVLVVVLLNLGCAIIPNLILLARNRVHHLFPWSDRSVWSFQTVWRTLHDGFWYYLTTISLVMKGHAFTFIVAAISGPTEAGLFYIVLRVTEVLVNVGSTASDTSLASLATAANPEERSRNFRRCWLYVLIFCAHSAVALCILGEPLLYRWLPGHSALSSGLGVAMAMSGLCGALSRVAVNASMGLGKVAMAARANLLEALLAATLGTAGYYFAGIPGLLIGSSLGILAMLPVLGKIAELCGSSALSTYFRPIPPLIPGVALAAIAQALASAFGMGWPFLVVAFSVTSAIAVFQLRAIHRWG